MDSSKQATPGPWEASGVFVRTPLVDGGYLVADVFNGDGTAQHAQAAINARLIAAAPELLAALCDLLEDADNSGVSRAMQGSGFGETLNFCRAAIAKATAVQS